MSEQEREESQKTVVAFIAGLLIGGLLVWVFGGTPESAPVEVGADDNKEASTDTLTENNDSVSNTLSELKDVKKELPVGNASVSVLDQSAGSTVSLEGATFPANEGWVGVRDYVGGQLVGLLGVSRYSKDQGLIPTSITLQRATESGKTYAVVFYSESGDRVFNLAEDVQVGGITNTFVAK